MPDYPTDEPRTLEKQGGERPDVPHDAQFTDPMQAAQTEEPAVWRPPNAEELDKLDAWAAVTPGLPTIASANIAVIDGYQDPTPGYAGPLAVLVFTHMDEGTGVTTVALSDLPDPWEILAGINQLRESGASPVETVEELGIEGDELALNAIDAELTDLDPVGDGDRVNYLERVADAIEAGADIEADTEAAKVLRGDEPEGDA